MAGFFRRYASSQGPSVLGQIEGVVAIDSPPPIGIQGVGTGTAAIVGEFADVSSAITVDAVGNITARYTPVEIFGGDVESKLGGFDSTLGDFGISQGNGFVEIANKRFTRLIAVAINLASSKGVRLWRKLPTNRSATDPTPAQPLQGAGVLAGREFKDSANRVRLAKFVEFTGQPAFLSNTNGAVTSGAPAVTRPFTGSGFDVIQRPDGTLGVKAGDIIVIGVVGGAGALGANADTYRVNTPTSATVLSLEKMDGSSFDWTTTTGLPYRIHVPEVADTGGATAITATAGYVIPARTLDATVAINVNMSPTIVPPAIAADSSDPLSGLQMRTHSVTGLSYTAALQGPNPVSSATVDAEYQAAIDSLLGDDLPQREVNILWAARKSNTIRAKIKSHVLQQKANGIGRVGLISPELTAVAPATLLGDAAPGVGAQRAEEIIWNGPGVRTSVRQAVGLAIKGADGLTHTDGILDTTSDGWAASILSNLAPHRNIGQAADPVKTVMAPVLGLQRGLTSNLFDIGFYTTAKARGACCPRMDRAAGAIFQSDMTTDLTPGRTFIRRRRMSFFIQDSLATSLLPFSKELLTEKFKADVLGAHVQFFEGLLSRNNPQAAQIKLYELDAQSGNTSANEQAGIFTVIHRVEMISTADVIVLQSDVGYGVLAGQVSVSEI